MPIEIERLHELTPIFNISDSSLFHVNDSNFDYRMSFGDILVEIDTALKSSTYNFNWNASHINNIPVETTGISDGQFLIYDNASTSLQPHQLVPSDVDWNSLNDDKFIKVNNAGELITDFITIQDLRSSATEEGKYLRVGTNGVIIEDDLTNALDFPEEPPSNLLTAEAGLHRVESSTSSRPPQLDAITEDEGYALTASVDVPVSQPTTAKAQIFMSTDTDNIFYRRQSSDTGSSMGSWLSVYNESTHPMSDSVSLDDSGTIASSKAVKTAYDLAYAVDQEYNANDVLNKLITVDGSGSGLDADMIDGYHFSDLENRYVNVSGDTMTGILYMSSDIRMGANPIRFDSNTNDVSMYATNSNFNINSDTPIRMMNGSNTQDVYLKSLMVSNSTGDSSKVPANGMYVKGEAQFDSQVRISNPRDDEGALKVYQRKNDPEAPATLLIATDADSNNDTAFEIRGNANGQLVDISDRATDNPSPDRTFYIYSDGQVFSTNNIDIQGEYRINGIPIASVPTGSILIWPDNNIPSGFMKCNGAAISRSTYSRLYNVLGTRYGNGNGSSTFNIPDLRGEFIRGYDDGRGVDSGRNLGSFQDEAFKSHNHTGQTDNAGTHDHSGSSTQLAGEHFHYVFADSEEDAGDSSAWVMGNPANHEYTLNHTAGGSRDYHMARSNPNGNTIPNAGRSGTESDHSHGLSITNDGNHNHSLIINSTGGSETRPRNIAMHYIIKY